jgi:hypothetical protein
MTKKVFTYCGFCDGFTHQTKLFSKKTKDHLLRTDEEYSVVQCLGCKTVSFFRVSKPNRKSAKAIHYNYPSDDEFNDHQFLADEFIDVLPKSIGLLYDEVIGSFDSESPILSGIGLRALVESICIDQRIQGNNLKARIQGLHSKGLISTTELPILDKLRLIGNISAHEIKSLPIAKLEIALGIINHVLMSIYILPKFNKLLRLK